MCNKDVEIYLLIFVMAEPMQATSRTRRIYFYLWLGAAWIILWVFFRWINSPEMIVEHSLNEIWRGPFLLLVNFIFFDYGVPWVIRKGSSILINILGGILLAVIQLLLISFGLFFWIKIGMALNIYTPFRHSTLIPDGPYYRMIDGALFEARGGLGSMIFFGMAIMVYHNIRLKHTAQRLRIEKQEAELNYLKSQTNPHFLFNTLNNIYSLARDKSDLAPESVLRLSGILRFMLYDIKGEWISIKQELELINNYIALEKLRYDDSMRISFRYEIEDMDQPLPPLLMIPLIENAFKHGASEASDPTFVDIHLLVSRQQLTLVVKNSSDLQREDNIKENIGLSNLRRQLELLYKDYNLSIDRSAGQFEVTLKINLASHV
jgi:sensor histidine kinase YesM